MIKILYNNKEICWWCGKQADSKEHRHKKSDVKFLFGNKLEGLPVIIRNDNKVDVQGPNSRFLKFPKVLYQNCNNKRSQPFDRAYDSFIKYVLKNYEEILEKRILDFSCIEKNNTLEFKQNVLRYLTKSFCCRLASNNFSIEPNIIEFLDYKKTINFLYFKFELRPDLYAFINREDADEYEGNIYLSPLRYYSSKNKSNIDLVYQFYNIQWLRIYSFYSNQMIEDIYSGYNNYNNSTTITVDAIYSVHPNLLFKTRTFPKLKENQNDEWLNEYLDTNIFLL